MRDLSSGILLFEQQLIAELSNVFVDQGTWFADYKMNIAVPTELMKFIQFSREQLSEASHTTGGLAKFASFIECGKWGVLLDGELHRIEGAPLFRESELSWV